MIKSSVLFLFNDVTSPYLYPDIHKKIIPYYSISQIDAISSRVNLTLRYLKYSFLAKNPFYKIDQTKNKCYDVLN